MVTYDAEQATKDGANTTSVEKAVPSDAQLARRCLAAGRLTEAEAYLRRVAQRNPGEPQVWDALGYVAHQQARHAEAERCFRRATDLAPGVASYHDHLAIVLRALNRLPEAIKEFEIAIGLAEDATIFSNFGNALCDAGDTKRAVEFCRRAVELKPESPLFETNLGRALMKERNPAGALSSFDKAGELAHGKPNEVDRGNALLALERYDEGIVAYRRAEAAGVRDFRMFHNLGTALQYLGRMDEANEAYRQALESRPDFAPSRRQLFGTKKFEAPEKEAEEIERLLKSPSLSTIDRADFHMGLAKIYDDSELYTKAAQHLRAGNQYIRSTIAYSAEGNTDFTDALLSIFNQEFFAKRRDFGLASQVPIFIIGMPRSGTTLVEQILCSHGDVHGAGELKKIYELFVGLRDVVSPPTRFPHAVLHLNRDGAHVIGNNYLGYIRGLNASSRYITDKMPFNFRALGLIALLYPNARIVHCRRDARDVCLSCYSTRFSEFLDFSFNQVELGRYYLDYLRLMKHWRNVVQNPILDVQYEDLVQNTEVGTRRLLEFCDLEWDPRCLDFHQTQRAVLTASNWQVRQPIYSSSIGRWRNYQTHLKPLFDILAFEREDRSKR